MKEEGMEEGERICAAEAWKGMPGLRMQVEFEPGVWVGCEVLASLNFPPKADMLVCHERESYVVTDHGQDGSFLRGWEFKSFGGAFNKLKEVVE